MCNVEFKVDSTHIKFIGHHISLIDASVSNLAISKSIHTSTYFSNCPSLLQQPVETVVNLDLFCNIKHLLKAKTWMRATWLALDIVKA